MDGMTIGGIVLVVTIFALMLAARWINRKNAPIYEELRIVTQNHLTGTRSDGEWYPASHCNLLYDDISYLREHDDGTHSYSFEYR